MPRTRSLGWSELKIGILAVTGLIILAVFVFLVGGQGGFFWQRYQLRALFDDVLGLKAGAVVRVAGVEVGQVSSVRFAGAEVEVVMQVSNRVRDTIRTTSEASIGSLSLLGEPVIDITARSDGEPLPEGALIPSSRGRGELRDVADGATRGLAEATALLEDVRGGRGTVGRLLADDTLYRDLQQFVDAAGDVAASLRAGDGTLGALLTDPAAYRSLERSLQHFEEISARISAGEGGIGRLLHDEQFARSLASATSHLDSVSSRIDSGEGTAGRLVNDPVLYDRLSALTGRLDRVAERLEVGDGTAGQLLQDRQLYENMNTAVSELRGLISDIREDPRRYLNVRVSIF